MKQFQEADINVPAVIITGLRRSGSSLILRLLDGHRELLPSFVEIYFLEYMFTLDERARTLFVEYFFSEDIDRLFDALFERMLLPTFREKFDEHGTLSPDGSPLTLDYAAMAARIEENRKNAPRTVQGVWNCWFRSLQSVMYPGEQIRPMVIKSPDYGLSARGAASFLSDFKVVFIIRDPLYAITSLRKRREGQADRWNLTTTRVLEELTRYLELHQTIEDFKRTRPEQMKVLRYEELVTEPERCMNEVCAFLGVAFDERVLEPTFDGKVWLGNSSFDRLSTISTGPVYDRRLLLTEQEIEMVQACLSDFCALHGYRA